MERTDRQNTVFTIITRHVEKINIQYVYREFAKDNNALGKKFQLINNKRYIWKKIITSEF